MKSIHVQALTSEGFRQYGAFYNMLQPDGYSLANGDYYPDKVMLPASGEVPITISSLVLRKTDAMIINTVECHDKTGEIGLPIDGDIIIHVAPASDIPVPELTEAFLVPKGCVYKLNAGVWHFGGFAVQPAETHVLIGLPQRTYKNDCTIVHYEEDDCIAIVSQAIDSVRTFVT